MTLIVLVYIYTGGWLQPNTAVQAYTSMQECQHVAAGLKDNTKFTNVSCSTITVPEGE